MLDKKDELILAVERNIILHNGAWQGLNTTQISSFLRIIQDNKKFLWRSALEEDPTYKQIIPYIIFQHQNTYFLMQRKSKASEQRLQNKYSLGIGGHVRQEDMSDNSLFSWAQREFNEEVHYTGATSIELLGVLNDDSNAVGQVHLGMVLLCKGSTPDIHIGDEHASGYLATLAHIQTVFDNLETWSQMVFLYLQEKERMHMQKHLYTIEQHQR